MYYFIRVNGSITAGGRPIGGRRAFNGLWYCLENEVVRIGWPETGDLSAVGTAESEMVPPHIMRYLETFRSIRVGSVILVPDKEAKGDLYIGEVTRPYHYFYDPPHHPYEHAHRVGVRWDRNRDGTPSVYRAADLAINSHGGFWCRALFEIEAHRLASTVIGKIDECRAKRLHGMAPRPARSGKRILNRLTLFSRNPREAAGHEEMPLVPFLTSGI